jgi:quercetin dioxygenase-like cupin family protein
MRGEEHVKRIICGIGDSGKNTVLFQGVPRAMGPKDDGTQAAPAAVRRGPYLAWAASALDGSTDDYAAELEDLHYKLRSGETRFMRIEIPPGAQSQMHRTPHINDYLVAISGELTMYTEDGTSVTFAPGDMLVQLAGWHWWKNEGTEPFVMAAVVIGIETDADVPFGVEVAKGSDGR